MLRIARPVACLFEWVQVYIGEVKVFAIGPAGVLGRDIILLRLPAELGHIVAARMQKVVLKQLGEDVKDGVGGLIYRVATFAVGIGWTGEVSGRIRCLGGSLGAAYRSETWLEAGKTRRQW